MLKKIKSSLKVNVASVIVSACAAYLVAGLAWAGYSGGISLIGAFTAGHGVQLTANGQLQDAGGGAGSGTVTNIATTYPLSGGPITATGTATYVGPTDSGRFVFVDATHVAFKPYRGDTLKLNGVVRQIPSAGISCPTSGGYVNGGLASTTASNFYYAYIFDVSGTLTCNLANGGHATSTTAGNVGTEIYPATDSNSLVGMAWTNASNQFSDTNACRCVASWFNRQPHFLNGQYTATRQYSANSVGEVNSEIRTSYVAWSDDPPAMGFVGNYDAYAGANGSVVMIGSDGCGGTVLSGTTVVYTSVTPMPGSSFPPTLFTSGTENAVHYFTICAIAGTSSGVEFKKGTSVTGEQFPNLNGFLRN